MKRFTDAELQEANSIDLPAYLAQQGIEIKRLMRSPFRDDQHPSFSVFCGRDGMWRGKDLSTGKVYDAIAIASKLTEKDFVSTVKDLWAHGEAQEKANTSKDDTKPQGVEKGAEKGADKGLETGLEKEGQSEAIQYEWLEDNTPALEYLTNVRMISPDVIDTYKQKNNYYTVTYTNPDSSIKSRTRHDNFRDKIKCVDITTTSKNGRTYTNRCVAFQNAEGGWMCRSINPNFRFEHKINRDALTVFSTDASIDYTEIFVFESAIDALSFASLLPPTEIESTTLIALNGCNNYKKLEELNLAEREVYLVLDNDRAGDETTKKIQEAMEAKGIPCKDIRHELKECKDVNELLIKNRINKRQEKLMDIIAEPQAQAQEHNCALSPDR